MHSATPLRPPFLHVRHDRATHTSIAPRRSIRRIITTLFFIFGLLSVVPARAQLVADGSFEGFDPDVARRAGFTPGWNNYDPAPLPGTVPDSWFTYLGSTDIFWSPDYVPHNFMTAGGGPGRTPFHGRNYAGISTGRFYGVWPGSETLGGTLRPAATAGRYLVRGRFAIGDYRNQPTFIRISLVNSTGVLPDFIVGHQLIATPDWNLFSREVELPAGSSYDRIRIEGVDSLPKNWGAFCFIDSVDVEFLASPSAPKIHLEPGRSICRGTCAELVSGVTGGTPPYTYAWTPADGLSCADCPAPRACPAASTTYRLTVTDADGGAATGAATVNVVEPATARISISRDLTMTPGKVLLVPVMLDDAIDLSSIGELSITLRYDEQMMRLLPEQASKRWTADGLLEGWNYHVVTDLPGTFSMVLSHPQGRASIPRRGRLLLLRFSTYLAMRDDSTVDLFSELPLEVDCDGNCQVVQPHPGLVKLTLCGLQFRLIETVAAKYAILSIAPNPVNSTADVRFSIGLDGPTRVEIVDRAGRHAATLLDDYLEPGSYAVGLDASTLPSGLYQCRITSGAWSESRTLMIVK